MCPQWSGLTNLEELSLIGGSLSGPLPPQWSVLTKLTFLNLNSMANSGAPPSSLPSHRGPAPPPASRRIVRTRTLCVLRVAIGAGGLPPEWTTLQQLKTLVYNGGWAMFNAWPAAWSTGWATQLTRLEICECGAVASRPLCCVAARSGPAPALRANTPTPPTRMPSSSLLLHWSGPLPLEV